uniref:Uncharacterized protein n=1 Tax=Panagrolaimus davidi TaxID=227884 RepID=A0A914Q564_9BILA
MKLKILRGTAATDFIVSDNYKEKGKLQYSKTSTFTTLNEDNNDLKKGWKNKSFLNITNKSTLSLHIAAYENLNEAVASDFFYGNENIDRLKKEKLGSIKTSKHCFTDRLILMNPFEFQRQQNENHRNKPENMQFKASQRLLGSQPPTTSQQIGNNGEQMPSGAVQQVCFIKKMSGNSVKEVVKMTPEAAAHQKYPDGLSDEYIFFRMKQWMDDGDKGITFNHILSRFKTFPTRAMWYVTFLLY